MVWVTEGIVRFTWRNCWRQSGNKDNHSIWRKLPGYHWIHGIWGLMTLEVVAIKTSKFPQKLFFVTSLTLTLFPCFEWIIWTRTSRKVRCKVYCLSDPWNCQSLSDLLCIQIWKKGSRQNHPLNSVSRVSFPFFLQVYVIMNHKDFHQAPILDDSMVPYT